MINVERVRTEFVGGNHPYLVALVPSESNPDKFYRVDVVNQRCSCPAWKFTRGHDKACKHLRALGFQRDVVIESKPAAPKQCTKEQYLAVKSNYEELL